MLAQERAFEPPMTFLPRHGTSTRFATGSQARPVMFWSAIEAASQRTGAPSRQRAGLAPRRHAEPAPHSTWQPPTSAAKVAPSAMKIPTSPAASIARVISPRPMPSTRAAPITEPGRQPQEPAVGRGDYHAHRAFRLHYRRYRLYHRVEHVAGQQRARPARGIDHICLRAEYAVGVVSAREAAVL